MYSGLAGIGKMTAHFDNPTSPHANASSESLALLALNGELLSNDGATLTVERWCERHGLASPARVIAKRIHEAEKPPTVEQRRLLSAQITDPVRYRRLRLCCGGQVLSEADNWYLPERLVVSDYFLVEDLAPGGVVHAEGDHKIHVFNIRGNRLERDQRFDVDFNRDIATGPARPHGLALLPVTNR